ncbi:MAG: hypothetical protein RL521_517 [Bacteroidota bacterium]|jgi:hypothetical protein
MMEVEMRFGHFVAIAPLLFLVTKCCAILFVAMFSKIIQKIGWQLHKFIQP